MRDIANFLFEVGMLTKTPRTGFRFLGSGCESVAEHVLRTIFIGYTLSKIEADVDELKVLKICLVHDLPEARTGDMNYMYKKYVTVNEEKAIRELTETLFFGDEVKAAIHVVWFCNALNFSAQYAVSDDAYHRDDLFEPVFDRLKKELPARVRGSGVLALFAGHPTKIRAEEFWDLNFYYGRNTPPDEWRTPRLRPQETMGTAQKNFRRMMRWLKSRDDIGITTYRALMDTYGAQKETMTGRELRAIAAAALDTKALAPTADFSPAEVFSGLALAIAEFGKNKALPASLATARPPVRRRCRRRRRGARPLNSKTS